MNTGGQAFPGPHWSEGETGMTLLDWMAGQALAGILADPGSDGEPEEFATAAYNIASAMLAEKARREADHSDDKLGKADHSPDAGKMVELEAANRELVEALESSVAFTEQWVAANTGSMLADARDAMLTEARAILTKHRHP